MLCVLCLLDGFAAVTDAAPKKKLLSEANPAFGKMLSGIRSGDITAENAEQMVATVVTGGASSGTSESKQSDETPANTAKAPAPAAASAPPPPVPTTFTFAAPTPQLALTAAPALAPASPVVDPLAARLAYRAAKNQSTGGSHADTEFMSTLTAWMHQADKRYEEQAKVMVSNSAALTRLSSLLASVSAGKQRSAA